MPPHNKVEPVVSIQPGLDANSSAKDDYEEEILQMDLLEKITEEEKEVIRQSWVVLSKNINQTALNIFEMIFSQSPDTKQLFPFMKIQTSGRSKEMEFHGLRFMQVLESVVKALDNPVSLDPLCDNLGRVHGRLAESRGFKAHHWGVFIECTLFHFRKVLSTDSHFSGMVRLDRAIILWRTILRVLIRRMKIGLNTDLKNRQANRDGEDPLIQSGSDVSLSPTAEIGRGLHNLPPLTHSSTLPALIPVKSAPSKFDNLCERSCLLRPIRDIRRRLTQGHNERQPKS